MKCQSLFSGRKREKRPQICCPLNQRMVKVKLPKTFGGDASCDFGHLGGTTSSQLSCTHRATQFDTNTNYKKLENGTHIFESIVYN